MNTNDGYLRLLLCLVLLLFITKTHAQWTFVGTMDYPSGKIKEYRGVFYALNHNGIYTSTSLTAPWQLMDGTSQIDGKKSSFVTDFWIQGNNILVECIENYSRTIYIISKDQGKSWNLFPDLEPGIIYDFRQVNDTLICYSEKEVCLFGIDFKKMPDRSYNLSKIDFGFKNYFYPTNQSYLVEGHQLYIITNQNGQYLKEKKVAELPVKWNFQQMAQGNESCIIWMTKGDSSALFLYNDKMQDTRRVHSFEEKNYLSRFSRTPFYLKFDQGIFSFVTYHYENVFTIFSKDYGLTWERHNENKGGHLEFHDKNLFYTKYAAIFYSTDYGKSFIPKTENILTAVINPPDKIINIYKDELYLLFQNITTNKHIKNTTKFESLPEFHQYLWQGNSDGEIFCNT